MVQVDAKIFGVSSTLTLTQPGSKAAVLDLHVHPVTSPSNLHKTSSLALEIKFNNMCVTFITLGSVDNGKRSKDLTKSELISPF